MTKHARITLLAPLYAIALVLLALAAPAADAAFGTTERQFEAGTCSVAECEYSSPPSEFYTQAAGHPERGITSIELNHTEPLPGQRDPEGSLKRLRVDVPPGLAANPEAIPKCSTAQFESDSCPAATKVGETQLTVYVLAVDTTVTGEVYNVEPSAGLPLEFGIHVEVGLGPGKVANEHIFLEGHVEWNGDYHEWFEINNISKTLPILKSKLLFDGRAGGDFLTLPSVCSSSTTSHVEIESYEGQVSSAYTHTPVGVEKCAEVPFKPISSVTPQAGTSSGGPDGATTVVSVPQLSYPLTNTADIKDAHVTLPEGLTLNPSAAHGLEACTAAEIGIGTRNAVKCPAASKVGEVTIETDLPPGSLRGNVYLASPSGAKITDPPFTIYIDAEAPSLDVSVRLQGTVTPNPNTGRLEVSFLNNPQLPFSELRLTTTGGEHAPLANPLGCSSVTEFSFSAYTGAATSGSTPFALAGCPSSTPFSLSQSTGDSSSKAGAYTGYTFNLTRGDNQQYVQKLTTTLPAGLVGAIPSVALCGEPQASSGSCSSASQIGTATVSSGAGDPYQFTGPVYLTGPYAGAPYGLSIPVEAEAGPFDLGRLTTRATINVDPHSSRVIVTSTLPTIFKGVPLRLRNISVAVNRANFLFNPTNCGALSTDTTLGSQFGATQSGLSSPFSVSDCGALAFKPSFAVATSASTNPSVLKANGAALRVNLLQGAHEANIHSVVAELPKSLPSRLTTLQKACVGATYEANPYSCPPASKVGLATVTTPVLPEPLKGPAYLVSHGGEAFPDLDLLLEGDNGIRVILESHTNIKNGITTSNFFSIPDVPVSSFVLELPTGYNSALTAVGALCTQTLTMPTTVTAQSGAVVKLATPIAVAGCTGGKGKTRIKIFSKRIVRHKLVLRVQTFAAGRVSVKARDVRTKYSHFAKPGKYTIKVPLSRAGLRAQGARKLNFKVRVGFLPKSKAESISIAYTTIGRIPKAKHKRKR